MRRRPNRSRDRRERQRETALRVFQGTRARKYLRSSFARQDRRSLPTEEDRANDCSRKDRQGRAAGDAQPHAHRAPALEEFGFEPVMTAMEAVAASVFGRVDPPLQYTGCNRPWTNTCSPGGFAAIEIISGRDASMPTGSAALAPVCFDCLTHSGRLWQRFAKKLKGFECSLHPMPDRPGHA